MRLQHQITVGMKVQPIAFFFNSEFFTGVVEAIGRNGWARIRVDGSTQLMHAHVDSLQIFPPPASAGVVKTTDVHGRI